MIPIIILFEKDEQLSKKELFHPESLDLKLSKNNIKNTFQTLFDLYRAKEAQIIIIGAGPSGIAAASRLLENGIDNIVILEAENRIGGRVNTIKLGKFYRERITQLKFLHEST
jgi:Predicted flavoprotein involved in K+ transport